MIKPVIAATAMLALAGGSLVYAQQQGFVHYRFRDGPRAEFRHRLSATEVSAFTDARIAALKAGLQLTPDQAKNWPPFEQAVRDMAQLRIDRVKAREAGNEQIPTAPFDRLARRAEDMSKRGAALKKVADAGAPLYQTLNDEQKDRFVRLARILRPHDGRDGRDGGWRHGLDRDGQRSDGRRFGQDFRHDNDANQGSQL